MVNYDLFSDPRFRVFIQDGRTHLLACDRKYDVVVSEAVHPSFQGNAALYSRDHYENCRRALAEDGVMSLWIPAYMLSDDDLRVIMKTFVDVFPNATLWCPHNSNNKHLYLVHTPSPLKASFKKIQQRMAEPEIQRDLAEVDLDSPYTLLTSFLLDEERLRQYCGDVPIHTDNHPYLAFSCPRSLRELFVQDHWMERVREMRSYGCSVLPRLTDLGGTEQEAAQNEKMLRVESRVTHLLCHGFMLQATGRLQGALQLGREALELNPENGSAQLLVSKSMTDIAQRRMLSGRLREALQTCQRVVEDDPSFARAYVMMSRIYYRLGNLNRAIALSEKALVESPRRASWRYTLTTLCLMANRPQLAEKHLLVLQEQLPGNSDVERRLRKVRAFLAQAGPSPGDAPHAGPQIEADSPIGDAASPAEAAPLP
jgi:tetratricopeptide (TPR) repeat protein